MALPLLLDAIEQLSTFDRVVSALPRRGERVVVGGLHGSSDAVLLAALARRSPTRFFAVVADDVAEAERWLADLRALRGDVADVALYPPREGLGEAEPHLEVAGERVETLDALTRGRVRLLLTTARALLERTRLPATLASARLELARGDTRRPAELAATLEKIGYERVDLVGDVAEFSVRGGIIDLYGFGMAEPVRAEFWGDEIVELRHFDLVSQRSTTEAGRVLVLPVDDRGVVEDEGGNVERRSLAELFPQDTIVVVPGGSHVEAEMRRTWDEAAHHILLARRRGEDVPDRDDLFITPDEALKTVGTFGALELGIAASEIAFALRAPEPVDRDMKILRRLVRQDPPTLILCDNNGQAERLEELLAEGTGGMGLPASLAIGVIAGGFVIPSSDRRVGLRVLTDHEIFRRERRLRRTRRYVSGAALDHLTLKPGDYVVHLEQGIGIYRGIERIFVRENVIEVAVVEYEGGDRLNVPLYRLDLLERYRAASSTDEDSPPPRLHTLGGKRWKAQRDKTRAAIEALTLELLDLYARRRIARRPAHLPDTTWQRQLESSFLFEDTPDQIKATEEVKRDLEGDRPMDRLLVGDVGYGKTEIAVRAAFKAVQSGRQVAVLVPTTILAEQHARTMGERLADFPVRIETMSRFRTAKEQAAVLADLAAGKVDIVIGTHRLLSADVTFGTLGLIVIDEEHRFGVKHKERLKQLRLETDVLTLTATPIPRTLHQSLAGLRDMTLMQTPPRDRSPVLTFVEPWDDGLIEEGISRELDRGGQVFFVHNRIETITAISDHVRRLVPRARIAVAHGRMKERDLEEVMRSFVAGDTDVLVSTVLVESGLDVPNANTIFINRADHFGLAQLYQLRGRVGRSHRRAYCYLVVPDEVDLESERRLQVLEHHTELGSGYRIALKDLELRGAGNLLGPEQSGFLQSVGFDLYLRMLEETAQRIRRGDTAPRVTPTDVTVDAPTYLPDDYIASAEAKLDIYRRLTRIERPDEVRALREELRDRFGPLPPPAEALLGQAALRLAGGVLGIEGILVRGDEARVTFRADALPRMKGLSAAFHEVQFQADVKRAHPLSLKLTRLGGAAILDGLVRALSGMAPTTETSKET